MTDTIQSDIFKFVALRPPVSIDKKNQETNFIKDERQSEKTPVGKLVASFDKKDGTKIPEQTKDFIKSNKFSLNFPESEDNTTISKIAEIVNSVTSDNFNIDNLKQEIENILDVQVNSFLDKSATKALLDKIWDNYYAYYILSKSDNQNLDELTKGLRIFHVLKFSANSKIPDFETLQKLLTAKPLIDSLFTDLPKPSVKIEKPVEEKPNPEKIKEYKKLWTDLIDTHRAIDEIKNIKFETKLSSETKNLTIPNKETGIEEKGKLTLFKSNLAINKSSLNGLHSSTKAILNNFNLNEGNFQIAEPITKLQDKLNNLYFVANNINDVNFVQNAPLEARSIRGLTPIIENFVQPAFFIPFIPTTNVRASIKPLGIGELKVVKQTLKKYVAGEVAHIENVLRGEYKERKHRVLDRTEDIFTVSNETNEETTKDTQTTERFELKKESEKTLEEKMSVEAGVTVSGSYGMVTFGAHGDFAYSTASKDSNKSSSNFAREVIDKSVSKIQKKTKEERTTKKLHEVEEINTHGIDNKEKTDHAVGIYRWVDKHYEAQIYNYGKRMMFEFIIPEPAAFYEYAQTHRPKKDITAPQKLPDNFTHRDVTEANYNLYLAKYNVQGITTPPPQYRSISVILSSDANIQNGTALSKTTKELIVPEGYTFHSIAFSSSVIYENFLQYKMSIGADMAWAYSTNDRARRRWDASNGGSVTYSEGIIPVSVNCYDANSFFINVCANCERTDAKYEQWQIQTFEKIMTAYKAMQAEYEQKLAAQEVQQGIAITGQNPRINREIEKTELKKQCVKMLMDTYLFGSFNAMRDRANLPPDFDIFDAIDEGKTIQFFEQAFEWENLTYLFYPYFWARKEQWVHKSSIYDNDPLFTKFLQAGSSRVVLPVHPAYNDAIMYFLENNGAIWNGGEPPRLNDPLFLSLADELRSQTDDLGNAIPEGKPWEVILPTTLVYLQQDSVLPTF